MLTDKENARLDELMSRQHALTKSEQKRMRELLVKGRKPAVTEVSDVAERLRALADLAFWAGNGWDIPPEACEKVGRLALKAAALLEQSAAPEETISEMLARHNAEKIEAINRVAARARSSP